MELERTLDSREVAELIGKAHKELLRDIRKYVSVLTSANLRSSDYFIPNEYLDAKKEPRPCYLLSKIGCDLVANKLQGTKGIEFTAIYVKKFEDMEQHIKADTTQLTSTKVQLKALLEHEEKLEQLQVDVSELKNEIDLTRIQKKRLSDIVRHNAMEAVGGKKSEAYKPYYKIAIAENWRSIKNYFEVASYEEIPRLKFDEAVELAKNWSPSAELKMNIKKCLQQQQLV